MLSLPIPRDRRYNKRDVISKLRIRKTAFYTHDNARFFISKPIRRHFFNLRLLVFSSSILMFQDTSFCLTLNDIFVVRIIPTRIATNH